MIDFYKFSPISVWGKDVSKKSKSDFLKEITINYDNILKQVKDKLMEVK